MSRIEQIHTESIETDEVTVDISVLKYGRGGVYKVVQETITDDGRSEFLSFEFHYSKNRSALDAAMSCVERIKANFSN